MHTVYISFCSLFFHCNTCYHVFVVRDSLANIIVELVTSLVLHASHFNTGFKKISDFKVTKQMVVPMLDLTLLRKTWSGGKQA